ncbi:HalOD1 output domain-containing protein [Natronolimnohabitans innermongolicus]|uniref:Halobacterial output domain-containing protein n=1 Tax=Natronolimnohabitans innermongolicus JCM 12255 TaxID=1227499 RepID=L9WIL3_9EURY|nr:HalOD1 output domain-containing protein [Natronolimnohabitans innermongolicus]ELY49217.1 hypothetical protein C493_21012 [Natronolimnohabitans innermongolicus JCM 12255]
MIASSVEKNTPVNAVIEAVAETTDSDPLDLPPLYDAVDPDALNTLITGAETNTRVQFQYAGFDVVVQDEEVILRRGER